MGDHKLLTIQSSHRAVYHDPMNTITSTGVILEPAEQIALHDLWNDEATIKLAGLVTTIDEAGALVSGDCWALAGELNKRLDWPIIVLSDVDGIPIHMTVEAPDGRLLDAEALWSRDDFIRAWENEYESINPDGTIDYAMGRYHIGCWTGFHTGEPQFARYDSLASTGWNVSYETGRLFPEVNVDAVASKIMKVLRLPVTSGR